MKNLLYTLLGVASFGLGSIVVGDPNIGPHCDSRSDDWYVRVSKVNGSHYTTPHVSDTIVFWVDYDTPDEDTNGKVEIWVEDENQDMQYATIDTVIGDTGNDDSVDGGLTCGGPTGDRSHTISNYIGWVGIYESGGDRDNWECHRDWEIGHGTWTLYNN